jgi:hypothetical protein
MPQFQTQSIPQDKFLRMAMNLLHKSFVESARTDAKNAYREIADGKAVHLTTVRMEDGSTSRFNLKFDHTEFRGKLNYGAFRASLATLIGNVSQALQDEREINVFNADEDPNTMIFGVTAVTLEEETPNVMVLGVELGNSAGEAMLSLMYLDPSQFVEQSAGDSAGETA